MVPIEWEPFRVEVRAAVLRNMRELNVAHAWWSALKPVLTMGPVDAARHAQQWLHGKTTYRFDARLAACSVEECLRRGFTACADVAAIGAAFALLRGARDVEGVVVASGAGAHLFIVVDGVEVDAYSYQAARGRELARWSIAQDVKPPR